MLEYIELTRREKREISLVLTGFFREELEAVLAPGLLFSDIGYPYLSRHIPFFLITGLAGEILSSRFYSTAAIKQCK